MEAVYLSMNRNCTLQCRRTLRKKTGRSGDRETSRYSLLYLAVFGFPEMRYSVKLNLMDKERWLERKQQNTATQKERFQWKFRPHLSKIV